MSMRRVLCIVATLLVSADLLYPCYANYEYPIATPFDTYNDALNHVLGINEYDGPFSADQVRFIYPFMQARPEAATPLWQTLWTYSDYNSARRYDYDSLVSAQINLTGFRRALSDDDFAAAGREANAVIERVVDLPPDLADACQAQLRTAVEFLELAPLWPRTARGSAARFYAEGASRDPGAWPVELQEAVRIRGMSREHLAAYADSAATSPRAPSLAYVAIQEALKQRIPDGWGPEIRDSAPPQLWRSLHEMHARWLSRFPHSPIADLVRFSEVRVLYFEGDSAGAWRQLLQFYPDHHYARALAEMRYLWSHAEGPDSVARHDAHFDGPLRAATTAGTRSDWCTRWNEAASARPAAWAINVQERLMHALAQSRIRDDSTPRSGPPIELPGCFPAAPEAPTPFWGRMRLMALVAAERGRAAREQLAVLNDSTDIAPLRARFALEDHQWSRAARTPGLDTAAVRYLVRVLAPDSALEHLAAEGPAWIRLEAAITHAAARAADGDWSRGAAIVDPLDPQRAARWRTAAAMSRDTTFAGRVAFARHLHRERDRLMFVRDGTWLRSVGQRIDEDSADTFYTVGRPAWARTILANETSRIERHLFQTTVDYLALQQYGLALEHPIGNRDQVRRSVAEANALYRTLVNWRHGSTPFWFKRLRNSREGRAIRAAGHS